MMHTGLMDHVLVSILQPTTAPLLSQTVFELKLIVEFRQYYYQ